VNEQDLTLIERHYRHELDDAERQSFEARMADDAEFKASVLLYAKAALAIRSYGHEQLKQRLGQRPMPEASPTKRWYRHWRGGSVIAGLLLLAGWWLHMEQPTGDGDNPVIIDTIPADQEPFNTPAAVLDTPYKQAQKDQTAQKAGKPDIDSLFAESFEPYAYLSVLGSGNGDETSLDTFLLFYRKRNYGATIDAFDRLPDSLKRNDNNRLLLANALLSKGRTREAVSYLQAIQKQSDTDFKSEAGWYLALAQLKMGKVPDAKALLNQLAADPASTEYREKAKALLEKLR